MHLISSQKGGQLLSTNNGRLSRDKAFWPALTDSLNEGITLDANEYYAICVKAVRAMCLKIEHAKLGGNALDAIRAYQLLLVAGSLSPYITRGDREEFTDMLFDKISGNPKK